MELLDRTTYPSGDPRAFGATSNTRQAYASALSVIELKQSLDEHVMEEPQKPDDQTESKGEVGAITTSHNFQTNF